MTFRDVIFSPFFWMAAAVVLIVIAFFAGSYWGRSVADSNYLQEREERIQQIAVHQANEKKLAEENDRLKAENELKAEALRQADTAAEAKRLQEFQKLQDARQAKGEEIENASPGESVAGLCDDARKAGLRLSFCG